MTSVQSPVQSSEEIRIGPEKVSGLPADGFSAVILAGGKSSRMGKNKAELEICGKSFVRFLTDRIRKLGITDILISGYKVPVEHTRSIPDIYPGKGPLAGIHAGLSAAENAHVLVVAVDTPLVPDAFLQKLAACHLEHLNTAGAFKPGVTAAFCGGRLQPLTAIYEKRLAKDCEELLCGNQLAIRALLEKAGYTEFPFDGEELLIRGCNTPEDYACLKACFSRLIESGSEQ